MFTTAWWYLFATFGAILTGLFVDPAGFFAAVALCAVQILHFGVADRHFFSFSCQVRYVITAILAACLWEPLRWIAWIPVAGLTLRLTLNYCLLARLLALLPWNRSVPFEWSLLKRIILMPPTSGPLPILKTFPAEKRLRHRP